VLDKYADGRLARHMAFRLPEREGFVEGRVTWLETKASRTGMPIPPQVLKLLREWHSKTPYNAPGDWVFASPFTKGARPYWPDALMKDHIPPVALKLGLPKISWNSFRHSAAEWAKRGLKLQEARYSCAMRRSQQRPSFTAE
jgi:integrase